MTPCPRYWKNPSDSVAKEFYRWVPDGNEPGATTLTVIVGRIKPGAEPDVARIFAQSDAGRCRPSWGSPAAGLYSIDDVYVHLLEHDSSIAEATRDNHDKPAFAKIMDDLSPYVGPYRPEARRPVARVFYRWRADS